MENTIFYILIFAIGSLFGSFFTLAVYRIPLHQDITHKRSYCPKCNHKLSFFDMIPIVSYLFLKGRCRYCKEKIRIRYLFLEIFTGIVFLLFGISLNLNFENIEISKFIYLLVGLLYFAGLIIISGIDKEKRNINKNVILYETILLSTYTIYLYIVEKANIFKYVIYLFLICILLIYENKFFKNKLKDNYTINILILSIIITMFSGEFIFIITVAITLLAIAFSKILSKLLKSKTVKTNNNYYKNLPIGFYLCCCNIVTIIIVSMMACRWMI